MKKVTCFLASKCLKIAKNVFFENLIIFELPKFWVWSPRLKIWMAWDDSSTIVVFLFVYPRLTKSRYFSSYDFLIDEKSKFRSLITSYFGCPMSYRNDGGIYFFGTWFRVDWYPTCQFSKSLSQKWPFCTLLKKRQKRGSQQFSRI